MRHTLEKMASGGTYDHVEGGFFRYSTTQDWSVPHYEKMLEDHAGLVHALSLARMPDVLATTTGYLDRVLRDTRTGLYAGSQDADEHYYAMDAQDRAAADAPYVDRRVYTSWNAASRSRTCARGWTPTGSRLAFNTPGRAGHLAPSRTSAASSPTRCGAVGGGPRLWMGPG
jgi:uncharacterized protein YyaL (SSP411 family)